MIREAGLELFPRSVIHKAKQVAAQPDARFIQSVDLKPLVSRFQSEDKCRAYLERLRWPDGVRCPRCEASKGISRIERRHQFECDSCGYQFSVRAGTIFHDSHLPLWKWFLAVYVMNESEENVSANQLTRLLGICYTTAWHLRRRLRPAMKEETLELRAG
jgi:transposase-like protein